VEPDVEFAESGDVAYLTLRGPNLNSFARAMHHVLADRLRHVRDLPHIRFVVLRGAGGIFSSGGDLDELQRGLPDDYVADYEARMEGTIGAITAMDKIVVSVIEGAAIGAAAALALSADVVLCADDARLRLSFVHVGFAPDAGATYLLGEFAGAAGRDILLTGRDVPPVEAQQRGLISRVCPPAEVDERLDALLDELRQAPAYALALTKRLMRDRTRDEYLAAVKREGRTQPLADAQATPDLIDAARQRHRKRQQGDPARADRTTTPSRTDQGEKHV